MLPYKLLFLFTLISSTFSAVLYDYGESAGDQVIAYSDSPSGLRLQVAVKFLGESQQSLYLYSNGLVTFKELPDSDYRNLMENPYDAIAAFYVPTTDGTMYYRDTISDSSLLNKLSRLVKSAFPDDREFRPVYAVIVTWDDNINEKVGDDHKNKFQLVLMTDEISSYALFVHEKIDWAEVDKQYATTGVFSADGRRALIPASGTDALTDLPTFKNIGHNGNHLYRLSGTSFEDPKTEQSDDSEENEDAEEVAPDEVPSPDQPSEGGEEEPTEPQVRTEEPEVPEYPHRPPEPERETVPEVPPQPEVPEYPSRPEPEPVPEYQPRPEPVPEQPVRPQPPQPEPVPDRAHPYPPYRPSEPRFTTLAPTHAPFPREPERPVPRIGEGAWYPGAGHPVQVPEGYNVPLSCAAANATKLPCDAHAHCNDYHPGFCCECDEGFYGNGEECLKKGDNERMFGTFEGTINGVEIKGNKLHTFANTAKGQAYVALTDLDGHLGQSLLLADEIASVIGWLYAKIDSPGAYNGFQLTGGVFNRTVNIHIGDRHALMIKQHFTGRDIHNYFQVQMYITGTIPHVDERSHIVYPPRDIEYRREGPGFVRAHAFYNVVIKEQGFERPLRVSADQQIYYKECPFKQFDKEPTVVVKVTRPHVVYDMEERNVRYASENKAMNGFTDVGRQPYRPGDRYRFPPPQPQPQQQPEQPTPPQRPEQPERPQYPQQPQQPQPTRQPYQQEGQEPGDPCAPGKHICTLPNMKCVSRSGKAGCVCEAGFRVFIDPAAVPIGWRCQDIDECYRREHDCDPNAQCRNTVGSFECTCKPGFTGDGKRGHCQRTGDKPFGTCYSHEDCHQWGECVFGQHGELGHCKCRGWYKGDGVTHCGDDRTTPQPAQPPQPPRREPQPGTCGWYVCHEHADCIRSPSGSQNCKCREGYYGNGVSCEPRTPIAVTSPIGARCTSHQACGEHANCVHHADGFYKCVCVPPYVPDGGICVQRRMPAPAQRPTCNIENNCDRNAQCLPEGDTYRCVCRPGFSGNGYTCASVEIPVADLQCDRLQNCGPNATCYYDRQSGRHRCRCLAGFSGDGYSCVAIPPPQPPTHRPTHRPVENRCRDKSECHRFAHCVHNTHYGEYVCECLNGFKGDGVRDCHRIIGECNLKDRDTCGRNAECSFSPEERAFKCKCLEGFTGDGQTCIEDRSVGCDRNPSICHEQAQCSYSQLQRKYVCICKEGWKGDGYRSCQMTEDQKCAHCSAHARCVMKADGEYGCKCDPGYQGNGQVCAPFTSCLSDRTICDANAECVPGTEGYYVCNCKYGYHGNGRTCTPDTDSRDMLLIARGMSIIQRGMSPDAQGKAIIIKPNHLIAGLDFDCKEERVLWTDARGSVNSAFLNASDSKQLFKLKNPEGVAIDWSSRNFYYVETKNTSMGEIGVASLDGKYRKIIAKEGMSQPRYLALDLNSRKLYYTDWNRANPKIGRMNLDGTEHEPFVDTDLVIPNGLVLLQQRRELCWVDAGAHKLSCIGLDGQNRRVVYASLDHPFGLAVYNERQFYWTDYVDTHLYTVSIDGSGYASFTISWGLVKPTAIVAIPSSCKGAPTPCAINNGGCAELCLPTQSSQPKCVAGDVDDSEH